MEFDCENMTVFGCPARDTAKNLILHELMEGSDTYMELKDTGVDRQIGGKNGIHQKLVNRLGAVDGIKRIGEMNSE